MKKLLIITLASLMLISLVACAPAGSAESDTTAPANNPISPTSPDTTSGSAAEALEFVTVKTLNADREEVEIQVPYNPQRLAVMDLAILDMIDNYGFGDRVVGVSKGSSIDYLQSYVTDDSILNLGTIKEASLETVMECQPDIIFIGGRLSASYDALSEIAPVVYLATNAEIGLMNSINKNAMTIASIFGVEESVSALLVDFDARIAALQNVSQGKTAFVGILNAGALSVLGNDGRCSIIGVEVGFENIGLGTESGDKNSSGEATVTSTHGNETSFEYIARLNPDYIFVMNRDEAIGTEGALPAKEVVENELIMKTSAYENGNIIYLAHSNIWYTAEGGITALDYMLGDLESEILK